MRMMIFGAGFSGRAIAAAAQAQGATVAGTTRSAEKCATLETAGIRPFLFDGSALSPELEREMAEATHLVQSIAPGREGDALVRLTASDLRARMPKLQWIGYLSTIGVYGDRQGEWVDESASTRPVPERSRERVVAEDAWMKIGGDAGLPVAVLRLSGIYGPGRNAFVNLEKGTARRLIKPGQVFNRIRVEDIGRAALFLANRGTGGVFNITDDEPAPPQDVITEAARLMGVTPPPEQPFETAELTPMARSFYGENKRVSNRRIKAEGFEFRFPNYRISLAELWRSGNWRG